MKLSIGFLVLALLTNAFASSLPQNKKLAQVPERMQAFVDDKAIAGAVTLVARNGQIAALDAVGQADIANTKPMKPDTMFWIASMTKPITATEVMILRDEGKLSVEDPVEKHLPEFKHQWLVETKGDDTMTLKRPARAVTSRTCSRTLPVSPTRQAPTASSRSANSCFFTRSNR